MLRNLSARQVCITLLTVLGLLLALFFIIAFIIADSSTGWWHWKPAGVAMILFGVDVMVMFFLMDPLKRRRQHHQPSHPWFKEDNPITWIGLYLCALVMIAEGIWWVVYPSVAFEAHLLSGSALWLLLVLSGIVARVVERRRSTRRA